MLPSIPAGGFQLSSSDSTFSVLAHVSQYSKRSSLLPTQRNAKSGYQDGKIPQPVPYSVKHSSPQAYRHFMTTHAPFSLLTFTGFRHVPKDSS